APGRLAAKSRVMRRRRVPSGHGAPRGEFMYVDFLVTPFSRYVSGDLVTPIMIRCWDLGPPYKVLGPEGPRQFPPGVPYGGPEAPARRQGIIRVVLAGLAGL